MKKFILFLLLCIVCAEIVFLHEKKNQPHTQKKLTVVATTNIIADAVKNIVGNYAHVYQLMGPGVDPHLYRARESDVHALASADIVFYNGLHLEGKMGNVLEGMHRFTKTIAVADALEKTRLRAVDFKDMYDPHVWFDVLLWIEIVRHIQYHMMIIDPENANAYNNNGDCYIKKLTSLHEYIVEKISHMREHQKVLITAHDAFGYFGALYGFEVIGLQGLSTDSDISTKDIQQLSDYIVEKKVHAIFVESSIPQRALIAVQNAVAAKGWSVEIGEELYSDSLGSPEIEAGSYVGMVMHNVNAIFNSLGE